MLNAIRFAPYRILIFFLLHGLIISLATLISSPSTPLLLITTMCWASLTFQHLTNPFFIIASFYKGSILSAWLLANFLLLYEVPPGSWSHFAAVLLLFLWTAQFSKQVLVNYKRLEAGINWLTSKKVSFSYSLYLHTFVFVSVLFAQSPEFVIANATFCLVTSTLTFLMFGTTTKVESKITSSARHIVKIPKKDYNHYLITLLERGQGCLAITESVKTSLMLRTLTKHIQWNKQQIPLKRELRLLRLLILLQRQRLGSSVSTETADLLAGIKKRVKVPTGAILFCVAYIFVELLETKTAWPFLKVQGCKDQFKLTISFNSISESQFALFEHFICDLDETLYKDRTPEIKLCLIRKEKCTELLIQLV